MSDEIRRAKEEYRSDRSVQIDRSTYLSPNKIRERAARIHKTYARRLTGHGHSANRDAENGRLLDYVTDQVILPVTNGARKPFSASEAYRNWHRDTTLGIIASCPITWAQGTRLTVGHAQKIVNLFTKDLWALDWITSDEEDYLDVPLDRMILVDHIQDETHQQLPPWTTINSYEDYLYIQRAFRDLCCQGKFGHSTPICAEALLWQRAKEAAAKMKREPGLCSRGRP